MKRQIEVVCSVNGNFHHFLAVDKKAAVNAFKHMAKPLKEKVVIPANNHRIAQKQVITKAEWAARQPPRQPLLKAGKQQRTWYLRKKWVK